jgi:RNA polymerase sigma factor (TIGR02999 family)
MSTRPFGERPPPGAVTRLLHAWSQGDALARDQLMPLVYEELRRRAAAFLRRERRDHTLRPTDLVHEAYLRLRAQNSAWQNREQFFAVAARLMRRVLVDHARARKAAKRGQALRVELTDSLSPTIPPPQPDLIELDQALEELARRDPRLETLVELRFFGGLTQQECAEVLGVSLATANREWALARSWLWRRLKDGPGADATPGD